MRRASNGFVMRRILSVENISRELLKRKILFLLRMVIMP